MEEYERVIIATDGSEETEIVIEKGLSMARLLGASVKVLFVVDTGSLSGIPPDEVITTVEGHIEAEAENVLDDIEGKAENMGIELEKSIKKGAPSEIIVSESEDQDIIVMGHHTRSGLSRLLTGSTAQRVIRNAECPVMVVRLEEE
ncbi:MAG: universal stress protein [Candidatus Thermoplasmatota archaeon]|nr:universal stress protein [Candidatus Thermoplasmatota archaeon]